MDQPINLGIFSDIKESNPQFYSYIEGFFAEPGSLSDSEKEKIRNGEDLNLLNLEVKVFRHFLGQPLTLLFNISDFYKLRLERNKQPNPEEFLTSIEDSRNKIFNLMMATPSEVWGRLLTVHSLDPKSEQWQNIGEEFRTIVTQMRNSTDATYVADKAIEFWNLYKQVTKTMPREDIL